MEIKADLLRSYFEGRRWNIVAQIGCVLSLKIILRVLLPFFRLLPMSQLFFSDRRQGRAVLPDLSHEFNFRLSSSDCGSLFLIFSGI